VFGRLRAAACPIWGRVQAAFVDENGLIENRMTVEAPSMDHDGA
jgi:hypothetical protein